MEVKNKTTNIGRHRLDKSTDTRKIVKIRLIRQDLNDLESRFDNLNASQKNSPKITKILSSSFSFDSAEKKDEKHQKVERSNSNSINITPKPSPTAQAKHHSITKNSILRQIKSDFNSKFLEIKHDDNRPTSRFGRQIIKHIDEPDVLYGKKKNKPDHYNPHLKMTPSPSSSSSIPSSKHTPTFISPIDKLINKNKQLAASNSTKNHEQNRKHVTKVINFDLSLIDIVNEPNLEDIDCDNKSISLPINFNYNEHNGEINNSLDNGGDIENVHQSSSSLVNGFIHKNSTNDFIIDTYSINNNDPPKEKKRLNGKSLKHIVIETGTIDDSLTSLNETKQFVENATQKKSGKNGFSQQNNHSIENNEKEIKNALSQDPIIISMQQDNQSIDKNALLQDSIILSESKNDPDLQPILTQNTEKDSIVGTNQESSICAKSKNDCLAVNKNETSQIVTQSTVDDALNTIEETPILTQNESDVAIIATNEDTLMHENIKDEVVTATNHNTSIQTEIIKDDAIIVENRQDEVVTVATQDTSIIRENKKIDVFLASNEDTSIVTKDDTSIVTEKNRDNVVITANQSTSIIIENKKNDVQDRSIVTENENDSTVITANENTLILNENQKDENHINANMEPQIATQSDNDVIKTDNIDEFRIGTIVWARMGKFPYWPGMVHPNDKNQFIMKEKKKINVRFFADRGRWSWVAYSNVMLFNGLADFENRKKIALTQFETSKSLRYLTKGYTVTPHTEPMWNDAIVEAEFMCTLNYEDRKSNFDEIVKSQQDIIKVKVPKRRKSSISVNDVTFQQLFSDNNDQLTSTPVLPPLSQTALLSQKEQLLSRSLTPESPAFELLTPSTSKASSSSSLASFSQPPSPPTSSSNNDEFQKLFEKIKKLTTKTNTYYQKENEEFLKILAHGIEMTRNNNTKNLTVLKAEFAAKYLDEKRTIKSNPNHRLSISQQHKDEQKKQRDELKKQRDLERQQKAALRAEQLLEKKKKQDEEFKTYIMQSHPKNMLFKGLNRAPVCKICTYPGNVIKCSGQCNEYVHRQCPDENELIEIIDNKLSRDLKESTPSTTSSEISIVTGDGIWFSDEPTIMCEQCSESPLPICFVCKQHDSFGRLLTCTEKGCSRRYHSTCLSYWPQNKIITNSTLLCPSHTCHTCISDDPRGKHFKIEQSKIIRCIQCPATYHADSCCIPAGTEILTATTIICPRHQENKRLPQSANWCFICTKGGKLICCETCPCTFHEECLNIPIPEKYLCEECESGRMPLYGELVWSKIGCFRWWPSIVVPPFAIPDPVELSPHNQHDFCVRFFGSNNYAWVTRGQVYLYQEDDSNPSFLKLPPSDGDANQSTKTSDRIYNSGLEKAAKLFRYAKEIKKNHDNLNVDKCLRPYPYVKIKSNRPVPPVKLNDYSQESENVSTCECKPTDMDPCGPESDCLNRIIFVECTPDLCRAGDACLNQVLQKANYPNLIERQMDGKGWGLVTLDNIARGSFVIEYVGELINQVEFQRRVAIKQASKDENFYFFTISPNVIIDAEPKGNLARFISHSCQPNLETQLWNVNGNVRVGLFALDDISANTELTFDYNWQDFSGKKVCLCGAAKCSGFIGQKYVEPVVQEKKTTKKAGRKLTKRKAPKRTRNGKVKKDLTTQPKDELQISEIELELKEENLSTESISDVSQNICGVELKAKRFKFS